MKNLAIIDGDFMCYIFKCNTKDRDTGEEVFKDIDTVKRDIDNFIYGILKAVNASSYLGYLTASNNFRNLIKSDYKANRTGKRPEDYLWIKEYLIDNWKFEIKDTLEADDCVNIAYNIVDRNIYVPWKCSPDKDVLSLTGKAYNPMKKESHYNLPNYEEYFISKQMIMGDSADGIIGLRGKGKVYAEKVLNEEYSSLDNLIIAFNEYLKHYSTPTEAISEFYKNYNCLKILDSGFTDLNIQEINTFTYDN